MPSRSLLTSLCAAILILSASSGYSQQVNPLESDPRAAYAGGVIFRAQCATCHGADARGIESIDAPDLTLMWTGRELADSAVFATIRRGIPGSIMPPHGFPDPEVWMLVSYLKSVAVSGTVRPIAGDSGRGQQLFAANCARCHRVAGQGGSLGPDLTRITARRSYAALVEAIRDPGASIDRNYSPVSLRTRSGDLVQGALKSEDAFSLQLMDLNQQLRGFRKPELASFERETESLMPSFPESSLNAEAIDDILSYLQDLP